MDELATLRSLAGLLVFIGWLLVVIYGISKAF
jgi:hypothetical protein